MLPVRVALLN